MLEVQPETGAYASLLRSAVVVKVGHDDGGMDDNVGGDGLRVGLLPLHDRLLQESSADAARLRWDGYA